MSLVNILCVCLPDIVLCDPVKKGFFQIELAAIVDSGMPFVQTTYKPESNGALVISI